jgi:hypothetical protein
MSVKCGKCGWIPTLKEEIKNQKEWLRMCAELEKEHECYIIGIFSCGCGDGNLGPVEIVFCDNDEDIETTQKMMRERSMQEQCFPAGAEHIILVDTCYGKGMFTLISGGKIWDMDFAHYLKMWTKRGREIEKENKRLEKSGLGKLFG